ncbi:MAG: hypothetical protein R3F14_00770 [Polyangiaceae bacterium]
MAAVHSVAELGTQDTRAWEAPLRYVADDNQGNVGVVEVREAGLVGAVSARTTVRPLECPRAARFAGADWQREALTSLCELPLLNEGAGVTAVFWTVNDLIEVPEAWEIAWESGLALFRRELLVDADWEVEGAEHYGLSSDLAQLAIGIARRAAIRIPLVEPSERAPAARAGELRPPR